MRIIGIGGRAGSGKDTLAARLVKQHGFVRLAFADPLKEGAAVMFRLSGDQIHGSLKEVTDERYGKSPRQIMQALGTEFGRNLIHPDLWVRAARARIDEFRDFVAPPAGVVMPDVRFPNEAEAIREWGGELWRVERPGIAAVAAHVSEHALDTCSFDARFVNDRSIEELHADVDRAFESLP